MTKSPLIAAHRDVAALARDFRLTDEQIVRVLELTPVQLARVANGGEAAFDLSARCAAARVQLCLCGLDAWCARVESSSGVELLLGRDLSVLAASLRACEAPDRAVPGRLLAIPREAVVGRNFDELLPVSGVSMTGEPEPGFLGLISRGLFDGRVIGHQVSASVVFGRFAIHGIWETWAVATPEAGILAHAILHRDESRPSESAGVSVHWTKWI